MSCKQPLTSVGMAGWSSGQRTTLTMHARLWAICLREPLSEQVRSASVDDACAGKVFLNVSGSHAQTSDGPEDS
eukprot:15447149-Alexandrium_andersonii.AAC.1